MAPGTFAFDKDNLTNLRNKIVNLNNDLMGDPEVVALQEWAATNLWDASTWSSSMNGGGGSGGGKALLSLKPGNLENFPAASLVATRGTSYASSVVNAVNWVHDVLTNLTTNIDFTIRAVENSEEENTFTAGRAMTYFKQTVNGLGGPSVQGPPTISINGT